MVRKMSSSSQIKYRITKKTAHGVQQEPALINQGAGVEGENHDASEGAEEGPEKKNKVQAAKTLTEDAIGRREK